MREGLRTLAAKPRHELQTTRTPAALRNTNIWRRDVCCHHRDSPWLLPARAVTAQITGCSGPESSAQPPSSSPRSARSTQRTPVNCSAMSRSSRRLRPAGSGSVATQLLRNRWLLDPAQHQYALLTARNRLGAGSRPGSQPGCFASAIPKSCSPPRAISSRPWLHWPVARTPTCSSPRCWRSSPSAASYTGRYRSVQSEAGSHGDTRSQSQRRRDAVLDHRRAALRPPQSSSSGSTAPPRTR